MEYTSDRMIFDLYDFETWNGANYTKDIIIKADKVEEFNDFIEDIFYDRVPTETEINDFLWFDDEYIFESLNINEYLVNFNLETFPAKGEAIEVKRLLLKDINEFKYNETEEEFIKLLKDELDPSNDEEVNDYINGDPLYILECFNIENPYLNDFNIEKLKEGAHGLTLQIIESVIQNNKVGLFIELLERSKIYCLPFTLDFEQNNELIHDFMDCDPEYFISELDLETEV